MARAGQPSPGLGDAATGLWHVPGGPQSHLAPRSPGLVSVCSRGTVCDFASEVSSAQGVSSSHPQISDALSGAVSVREPWGKGIHHKDALKGLTGFFVFHMSEPQKHLRLI